MYMGVAIGTNKLHAGNHQYLLTTDMVLIKPRRLTGHVLRSRASCNRIPPPYPLICALIWHHRYCVLARSSEIPDSTDCISTKSLLIIQFFFCHKDATFHIFQSKGPLLVVIHVCPTAQLYRACLKAN